MATLLCQTGQVADPGPSAGTVNTPDLTRPPNLPNYADPPVDEVAIGVAFPQIEGFLDAHSGIFWEKLRPEYPRLEAHPRLDQPMESLEPAALPQPPLPLIAFPQQPSSNRTWLVTADDEYVVQVQNTRFVQNWRRRGGRPYPHFEEVYARFKDHFEQFVATVNEVGLRVGDPTEVEVTYINWITDLPLLSYLEATRAASIEVSDIELTPDHANWQTRYLVASEGAAVAHLYAQGAPTFRPDLGQTGSSFSLFFRAPKLDGFSASELEEMIKLGRNTIVEAFTALTTGEAQSHWGRFQ